MIDDAQLARRLLDHELVGRSQLKEGRQLQLTAETTLYEALIRHGLVEEGEVVEIAANILSIPCVHLDEYVLDPEVVRLLPPAIARRNRALPLELKRDDDGDQLLLAMEDPLDIMAMDEIATHVSINIQPVLVGPVAIEQALDRIYAADPKRDAAPPPAPDGDDGIDFGEIAAGGEGMEEDSWSVFFDEAQSQKVPTEESSVISQDMRDRSSTINLDVMDIEEVLEESAQEEVSLDDLDDDPISLLDEPSMAHQSSESSVDLDGWDFSLDSAKKSKAANFGKRDPSKDYGEIGSFYVNSEPESFDGEEEEQRASSSEQVPARQDEAQDGDVSVPPPLPSTPPEDEEAPEEEKGSINLGFEALFEDDDSQSGTVIASPAASMDEEKAAARSQEQEEESEEIILLDEELADEPEPASAQEDDGAEVVQDEDAFLLEEVAPPEDSSDDDDLDEDSEGDLFERVLADIGHDSSRENSPASPASVYDDDGEEEGQASEEVSAQVPAADDASAKGKNALGRLKLKRIAVKKKKSNGIGPIVEKQSHRDSDREDARAEEDESPATQEAQEDGNGILSADDLTDDELERDVEASLDTAAQQQEDEDDPATREVTADDLLSAAGESLSEQTAAASDQARQMVEDFSSDGLEAGAAPPSMEGGASEADRSEQPTASNEALTKEFLQRVRANLGPKEARSLRKAAEKSTSQGMIPPELSDSQLIRAMVMLLVGKGLIDIEEVLMLAGSLPITSPDDDAV